MKLALDALQNHRLAKAWQEHGVFVSLLGGIYEVVMRLASIGLRVVLSRLSMILRVDAIFTFDPFALDLKLKLVALEVFVCQLLYLLKWLLKAELL